MTQAYSPVCTVPGCGAVMTDMAFICFGCSAKLISALKSIPELMDDMAVTLTKRSKTRAPSGNGGVPEIDPVKMPFNLGASHAKADLLGILVSWAKLVSEERRVQHVSYGNHGPQNVDDGPTPLDCALTCTALSGWLLHYMKWIRHYEAAADCVVEVRESVDRCRRVIDAPVPRRFIGLCPCGGNLWTRDGDEEVTCPGCETTWNVRLMQRHNLNAVADVVAYRAQCAMALTANGCNLSAGLIHKWQSRGLLPVARLDKNGRKMYRIGDVKALWDKHNEGKR